MKIALDCTVTFWNTFYCARLYFWFIILIVEWLLGFLRGDIFIYLITVIFICILMSGISKNIILSF